MATPTFLGQEVLDAQLNYITTQCDSATCKMVLVSTYARSHNYATVMGNELCSVTVTSSDFGALTSDTSAPGDTDAPNRRLPFNGKVADAATAGNGAGSDMSLVLVDTTNSAVISATDETTGRAIAVDDVVTLFPFYLQASQATQVA